MKQHHNTKWLSSLYRGMLLSASLLLVSGMAMAQLSGSYTINSASATSGTNFKSFADLTSALSSNGVKGAVVVDVVKASQALTQKQLPFLLRVVRAQATQLLSTVMVRL